LTEPQYAAHFAGPDPSLPLLERQRRLTDAVAGLTALIADREGELRALHQRLHHLHEVIGIPLGRSHALRGCKAFADTGPDLPPARQAEYRREIAELIDAKRKADEDIIEGLWAQIRALWTKLNISPAERAKLTTAVTGVPAHTSDADGDDRQREAAIEVMQGHLGRLQAEQQRMMAELVKETADMLRGLWQEYERITGERMAVELPMQSTESSVAVLEGLVLAMEDRLRSLEDVRKAYDRRKALLDEEAEMLRSQKDPDRLLSKKQNMAQLLLREEKSRNAIKRDVPKLEAKIRQLCAEWEAQHGGPVTLDGHDVLAVLDGGLGTPRPRGRSKSQADIAATVVARPTEPAASLSRPKSESNVGALLSPKHAHTAVRRDDRPVAAAAAAKPRSPSGGLPSPSATAATFVRLPGTGSSDRPRATSQGRVRTPSLRR